MSMSLPQYQTVITSTATSKEVARTRRIIYLRPFLLFWLNSLLAEIVLLIVAIIAFSGLRDMIYKIIWTLILCPLGMGGAMGGIVNYFFVDQYYGPKAVRFTALLTLLILGSCNYLCFSLDHYFGYFGAQAHPIWFHWRYPVFFAVGWTNGSLLFTDEGQKKLAALGM